MLRITERMAATVLAVGPSMARLLRASRDSSDESDKDLPLFICNAKIQSTGRKERTVESWVVIASNGFDSRQWRSSPCAGGSAGVRPFPMRSLTQQIFI